jgi:hypothetical protein
MGRAPDAHIFKKLSKKYFKFDIQRSSFNSASAHYGNLLNTWTKKGIDSPDAELIQEKIDIAMEFDEQEFREAKIMTKKLPYELNQILPKMKNKYHLRGHQRELGQGYTNTTSSSLKYYYKAIGWKQ